MKETLLQMRKWACNNYGEFFKRYPHQEKATLWFTADEVEKIIEHTLKQGAEEIDVMIQGSPAMNYEEDNYDAGRIHALTDAQKILIGELDI